MKKIFVLSQLFLSFTLLNAQSQTRGFITTRLEAKDHVALVIGNSAYPDNPLANPVNDAADVAEMFTGMGFIVEKVLDADKEQMAEAVNRFSARLRTAKAAVFYYAGHGMQVNGENYLIPIGRTPSTQISTEAQVPLRAFNAGEVLTAMEQAKVNFAMVVLDACRNNPLKGGGRGSVPGLASINAPAGSMVLYSTKAGTVASDGQGTRNSPFTTAFLTHIKTPGLAVNDLPMEIINSVQKATNFAQTPGAYTQVTSKFTFVPEISPEEIKAAKERQLQGLQSNLTELEAHQAQMARKKAEDDAVMARKQAELDALDRQIADLKNKGAAGVSSNDDLDQMLQAIKKREEQQKELAAMQKRAEEERQKAALEQQARQREIEQIKINEWNAKNTRIDADLEKYRQIASSEYGKDMVQPAWDNILTKYALPKGSVETGNTDKLKAKANPHPALESFAKDMVLVKGGTFEMGSNNNDDEKPIHEVTVGNFYIAKYEVTQAQWKAVMNSDPSYFKNCDNCPVEQVSWDDVQIFIKTLNQMTGKTYRLPTEAEWEYAARGGASAALSDPGEYAGSNNIDEVAWYSSNSGNKTHPVGQKKPNQLGLYDMSGNVWEWCADRYHDNYRGAPADGSTWENGSSSHRVFRGGGWTYLAKYCRVAIRLSYPDYRYNFIGFRLVLVP